MNFPQHPTGNKPAGLGGPLPRPGQATHQNSETAGQPPVNSWHASQARDYTPSPAVLRPEVLRGRGPRGAAKIEQINQADPLKALRLAMDTLISVLTQALNRNRRAAGAWCWTAVGIIDGLATLIEAGTPPARWFLDTSNWGLSPEGWAPPAALAPVAARIAGRPKGENQ